MTAHMQIQSPELMRQHQEAMARRARLSGLPAPRIIVRAEKRRDWLRVASSQNEERHPIVDIQRAVAKKYNSTLVDICSHRRTRHVILPRHIAMYLARHLTHHSLPEIGRKFGGRDHTTIAHGILKVEALAASDMTLAAEIRELISELEDLQWAA